MLWFGLGSGAWQVPEAGGRAAGGDVLDPTVGLRRLAASPAQ